MRGSRAEAPLGLARLAIERARACGAQQVSAQLDRERTATVRRRDGELESLTEAATRVLKLRLFVDGRYTVVSTSDLRPAAVAGIATRADGAHFEGIGQDRTSRQPRSRKTHSHGSSSPAAPTHRRTSNSAINRQRAERNPQRGRVAASLTADG